MDTTHGSRIRGAWRVALAACAVAAVLGVAACGGDDEATTGGGGGGNGGSQKVSKIAFFGFAKANSFAQATWAGVQEAAKKEGVEAEQFDPNFDSAKQVSQIQNAITS